jgi:3-deoxy-D-manno-octulosonic-acid transferase
MFARLSAWITARSVPDASRGRILVLAPKSVLRASSDWLDELGEVLGPIALGVTDCRHDTEARGCVAGLPALAMHPDVAASRLARLQPRVLLVLGAQDLAALGPALSSIHAPRVWINAEGTGPQDVEWSAVLAAHENATSVDLAEVIGDPIGGPVHLPTAPAGDNGFCERFGEYHAKGHPILLAPNTGPGEEAFAFAVLFAVLRKTAAILLLAPRDPERHEPVYRDAIKYSLPIVRHSRFLTSCVPPRNRVYYIEDADTLAAAYACADITLPGGTLAGGETPADLALPLACGSAVICGPAGDTARPEAVAGAVLARLAEGVDVQARRRSLAAWQQRQAGAREAVASRIRGLLSAASNSRGG